MKRFSGNNWLDALAKLGIVLAMINSVIIIVWLSMDWSVTSFYSTQNLLVMAGLSAVLYLAILYQVKRVFSKKKK